MPCRSCRASFVKGWWRSLWFALCAASAFLRPALAHERAGRPNVLISIFQRRCVDGLIMWCPPGDPDYYGARAPSLFARPAPGVADTTVDLDSSSGLHPRSLPLTRWDTRLLSVDPRVRSIDTPARHFDAARTNLE